MTKLSIFDFDETLCHTDYLIEVKYKFEDLSLFLNPTDYSKWHALGFYKANPSNFSFDFSEFEIYPQESRPNKLVMQALKRAIEEKQHAALVTGRTELEIAKLWLQNHGIDVSKMILMCSGQPDKSFCYESLIATLEPTEIVIYEDSPLHIQQLKKVCQRYSVAMDSVLISSED